MGSVGLIHKFKVPYHHEGGHGPHKDVHVHVHGGGGHGYPVYHSGESYWDRTQLQAAGQPHFWDRTQPQAAGQPPWGPPPDGQFRYPHQMNLNKKNPWDQFIAWVTWLYCKFYICIVMRSEKDAVFFKRTGSNDKNMEHALESQRQRYL